MIIKLMDILLIMNAMMYYICTFPLVMLANFVWLEWIISSVVNLHRLAQVDPSCMLKPAL